jgi:hypothetical protein
MRPGYGYAGIPDPYEQEKRLVKLAFIKLI